MNDHTHPEPNAVTPLLWAESTDENRNSHFEALSHVYADAEGLPNCYWRIDPHLEENGVWWRLGKTTKGLDEIDPALRFDTIDAAKKYCETREVDLGGLSGAPRPLEPNPDPAGDAPLTTDAHGFAPTRKIIARWSRKGGVLYLFRVWAKVENPDIIQERELHGEEFDAALPDFLTQRIVAELVARIVDGWRMPVVIEGPAIGCMALECEVHFAQAVSLRWEHPDDWNARMGAKAPREAASWRELPPPSHDRICAIVGQQLAERKGELDRQLAGTTVEKLQRDIVKNARALGLTAEAPPAEEAGGNVIPITLENMQKEGIDLEGRGLK